MLHSKSYIQGEARTGIPEVDRKLEELIRLLYNELEELETKIDGLEDRLSSKNI